MQYGIKGPCLFMAPIPLFEFATLWDSKSEVMQQEKFSPTKATPGFISNSWGKWWFFLPHYSSNLQQ
jgi:hypothetical protein